MNMKEKEELNIPYIQHEHEWRGEYAIYSHEHEEGRGGEFAHLIT